MKHVLIAGLALALSAGAAQAGPPQTPPLDQAYRDDVSCVVLYMAVAAKGEDLGSAAVGFYYFVGRLEARRPDVDWRDQVVAAAADVGQSFLEVEGPRCGGILTEKGGAMGPIDGMIESWSRGEGRMGAALQALRQAPAGS